MRRSGSATSVPGTRLAGLAVLLAAGCSRPPGAAVPQPVPVVAGAPDEGCAADAAAAPSEDCPEPLPDGPGTARPERPGEDGDGDGVEDILDACPARPEDLDGIDDEDGCPEP